MDAISVSLSVAQYSLLLYYSSNLFLIYFNINYTFLCCFVLYKGLKRKSLILLLIKEFLLMTVCSTTIHLIQAMLRTTIHQQISQMLSLQAYTNCFVSSQKTIFFWLVIITGDMMVDSIIQGVHKVFEGF